LPEMFVQRFSGKAGKKAGKGAAAAASVEESITDDMKTGPLVVTLNFKKHVFDPSKRFVQ
uniref:RFC1 n=1 Tax=Rodentolepis nana TaxID=102285 RepID=A0A0R3TCI2_RODNA